MMKGANPHRQAHGFVAIHRQRLNAAVEFGRQRAPAKGSICFILRSLEAAELVGAFRAHACPPCRSDPDALPSIGRGDWLVASAWQPRLRLTIALTRRRPTRNTHHGLCEPTAETVCSA
jgi:hypothetical protein